MNVEIVELDAELRQVGVCGRCHGSFRDDALYCRAPTDDPQVVEAVCIACGLRAEAEG